ncbi:MAG TPA: DUF2752 domain-containing protein [Niabella sp.]|jgi:hypothetical protein|nr:DUF2752 domain-containing protein [Chitinophagaceae bacterium]HRN47886.1 DUF2752 domain-containing protein [Niabella sp.]HRO85575.1 DUF2752 domain-containing protein [Niabella sp.]HUN01752.1 DUF2752 domain-containing protein [Niabella sp.]
MTRIIKQYTEPLIWIGALVLLFFMNVENSGTSLCILKAFGFNWCPGCGLGHSIHHALHLDFKQSLQEHWLGIPATLVLFYQSVKSIYLTNKIFQYGSI